MLLTRSVENHGTTTTSTPVVISKQFPSARQSVRRFSSISGGSNGTDVYSAAMTGSTISSTNYPINSSNLSADPNLVHSHPTLMIMASPKTGSWSLVQWLRSTHTFAPPRSGKVVENNELWGPIDSNLIRNDSGFFLDFNRIRAINDGNFISKLKK